MLAVKTQFRRANKHELTTQTSRSFQCVWCIRPSLLVKGCFNL